MDLIKRRTRVGLWSSLTALALATVPAGAQELTGFGVAGLDGDGTSIVLAGASVAPVGLGLKPVAAVQVYHLRYDLNDPLDDDADASVVGITPSIGAQYRAEKGLVEGRVGYSFQDEEVGAFSEGAGGSGFNTTLQANTWNTGVELQGIASFNWEYDFLWSQAQAVLPVARMGNGSIGVGADLIYQAEMTDATDDYSALQVGPVVRYNNGRNLILSLGGGLKDVSGGDNTYYARFTVTRYGFTF